MKTYLRNTVFSVLVAASLGGCGAGERLANIGKEPDFTKIENPQLREDYAPVSMPMPTPRYEEKLPNSLWASDRKSFFKDQRANTVGDILTVLVNVKDEAKLENETTRTRSNSEGAGMENFLGIESQLSKVLPEAVNPADLVNLGSTSRHVGNGEIDRQEDITLELAAIITQVLPNGNFVIHGQQEMRVNFEKRILQIDGIVRPEDISTENTINHSQIAEARIGYGGRGQLTDVQQPRYGQQVYDVLFPF